MAAEKIVPSRPIPYGLFVFFVDKCLTSNRILEVKSLVKRGVLVAAAMCITTWTTASNSTHVITMSRKTEITLADLKQGVKHPKNFDDITGKAYGRLVVTGYAGRWIHWKSCWHVDCSCGKSFITVGNLLKMDRVKSCGCLARDILSARSVTHGQARRGNHHKLYCVWVGMRSRCSDPTSQSYPAYGGRGIKVCSSWEASFDRFLSDMGDRPSLKHSIDRIDNNGNYEPGNCRWVTREVQVKNKRNNRFVEINGERMIVADWSRKTGVHQSLICGRLNFGWRPIDAVSLPSGSRNPKRNGC